jgi:NTE family protein
LGALRALIENKTIDIENIRRVGGTSAGAITAALLGVGYTLDELEQILKNELKFKDLLDNTDEYKKKFFELKEQLGQMTLQEIFVYIIQKVIQHKFPIPQVILSPFFGELNAIDQAIITEFGIFSGKKLRNFLDLWIKEKTKIPNATFEDIDKEIQSKGERCSFKHIYITGVDLITGKTFKFSHRHSPKMPIADAVRISISIPFIFEPVKYEFENQYGHTIKGLFVDGGVFDNYPLWMFDSTKYSNDVDSSEGHWVHNHKTLGMRIVDRDLKSYFESTEMVQELSPVSSSSLENLNLGFYLGALVNAFTKKQESDHHRQKDDRQRTIYIDSCDIGMLDFDLTDAQVENLVDSGKKAVNDYCTRINNLSITTHHVRLSFGLLASLFTISKNSKSPVQDNNIYQLIKENIDKQSLNIPTVIYSFYSQGTLEEISYLKTLGLDIKMKNEHGNTVLHLAALKNDRVCIERIQNDLELVNSFSNLEQMKNNDNKVYTDLFPK